MKNLAQILIKEINKNKITILAVFAVTIALGVPAYAHQVKQANLEKQAQHQAKLDEIKKQEELKAKQVAKTETSPPAPAPKPEPMPTPTPAPVPKKTYTTTTPKTYVKPVEEQPKPTYTEVSMGVTAVQSGSIVNVSINVNSAKPGTCTIILKAMDYTHVKEVSVANAGGTCGTALDVTGVAPGSYYVKAYFKASDYTVKGWGYTTINLVN